jgi:hypothetical protein
MPRKERTSYNEYMREFRKRQKAEVEKLKEELKLYRLLFGPILFETH